MGLLDRFRREPRTELMVRPGPAALKAAYEIINQWKIGRPEYPIANFENNVKFGFRRNELIYACIAVKCDSAAQATLRVHAKSDDRELENHPLRQLLSYPSRRLKLTEFDFHSANFAYQDLGGAAYWEKVRGRGGQVVELLPLRPDYVQPVPDSTNFISNYIYKVPGADPQPIDANDVLVLKMFDPLDQFNGMAPVSVCARSGDVDNQATDHVKNVLENGGMPMGLLTSKLDLDPEKISEIRAAWKWRYSGFKNWTEPAVLDSDATFQKLGFDFKELGFDVLDERNEARICMVLRVPPILVGANVGLKRSTYSNYEQARTAFWQETLVPQYKRVRDNLQMELADEWEDVYLKWDFSQVVALQEDQKALRSFALDALRFGGVTIAEFRKIIATSGLLEEPELDAVVGDVLLIPRGYTVRPIDPKRLAEQEAEAARLATMGAQGPAIDAVDNANTGEVADNQADDTPQPLAAARGTKDIGPLAGAMADTMITPEDVKAASKLWDRLMPGYEGMLDAESVEK